MMKVACCILALTASTSAMVPPVIPRVRSAFDLFRTQFNRTYFGRNDVETRLGIFAKNLEIIEAHNARPGVTYKMGVNRFADMTDEEFGAYTRGYVNAAKMTGSSGSGDGLSGRSSAKRLGDLPKHVDWRDKGIITDVKDQGRCGSCWAQTTAEQVESYLMLSGEPKRELSPQQLVDCLPNPLACGGSGGCSGATVQLGYSYVNLLGMVKETDYPYTSGTWGQTGKRCLFDATAMKREGFIRGFETLVRNDVEAVMRHIAEKGPLAIASAATPWKLYSHGVFDNCPYDENIELNHAIQLVGYGTDDQYGDYWLVRNSWGASWGEEGYIRLKRESEAVCGTDSTPYVGSGCKGDGTPVVKVCGMCGMLFDSSYPIGAGSVNTVVP